MKYVFKFAKELGYNYLYGYTTSRLIERFYYKFGFENVKDFNEESEKDVIWLRMKL